MRRIILSTDDNPTFAWFVPLCTLMWRDVAGFDVSCIFVGPVDLWLVERAREVGTHTRHVTALPARCNGPTASQLVRLFSYTVARADDYLMSVDADAWPLARAPFEPSGAALDLLYPDACDHAETPYFPIGYIGARAAVWREIMSIDAPSPEAGLEQLFRTDPMIVAGHSGWNYDETFITRKIKAWSGFPGGTHIARRSGDPPIDRIDRSAWPAHPVAVGKIDAHLIRPGWTAENWPRLRPLLEQGLTPEHLEWADAYRAEWFRRVAG